MKIKGCDIQIPPWISTHSYLTFTDESRSYITNEIKREYSQLDGLSSDLWFLLTQENEDRINTFINKNSLNKDVESFFNELSKLGILIVNGFSNNSLVKKGKQELAKQVDVENQSFIEERNTWLWDHKFMSSILFELTYRCNLKCIHCYNPKDQCNVEINFDDAKHIIDEAYELGCFDVTLTGGESTTYSHFLDLCEYIRNKHMSLTIFTNGQSLALNDNLYNKLISFYPHQVSVSIYSNKSNVHDRVTSITKSYNNSKKVITKLCIDNVHVQIKNFLLNFACRDCVEVQKFATKIGATNITDVSLIPTIEGDKKTLIYEMSDDDLFFLYSNPESPLYIGNNSPIFDFEKNKKFSPCLGGFNGLCVTPNCDFKICVSMPLILCNYKNTSLCDLWKNAMNKDAENPLFNWQKITNSDLKECYKHDYCKFCHYCVGMATLENGYLKKSNVLCKQAKAKLKAYNFLKEKGKI